MLESVNRTHQKGLIEMRGHGAHMWICGAMIAVAVVLVAATGNAAYLLPAIGCVAMMAMMMWMMMGAMGGHGDQSSDKK
jgi:hypothetical protein